MAKPPPSSAANVSHFAINADDLPRARRFYQRVFGWRFEAWGPPGFFMIDTGTREDPGIRGSLQQRRELIEGHRMIGYECSIGVPDIDAVIAAVQANGGAIVLPKMLIPTVGYIMFFRDTEGNVAGVAQYEPDSRADQ